MNPVKLLRQKIYQGSRKYNFNASADTDAIETFEVAFGLELDPLFKNFLELCDGGMIMEYEASFYIDMTEDEPDSPKNSSNYFFTLNEIQEYYIDAKLFSWFFEDDFEGVYPLIPIAKTPDHQLILMLSQNMMSVESPLFLAKEGDTVENIHPCAENFDSFLEKYIEHDGFPPLPINTYISLSSFINNHDILEGCVGKESYEAIVQRTTAMISLFPKDAWAYNERGIAHRENGHRNLALQDFNTSITLEEKAFFYFCRGDLLSDHGSSRKALIDLDIAVKLEPGDHLYLCSRAEAFFKLGHYDKAITDCNSVLAENGIDELALMVRCRAYRAIGSHEKADADSALLDDLQR